MTISIVRTNSTDSSSMATPQRVQPADVWDLDRRRSGDAAPVHVRTLESSNRKYGPIPDGHSDRDEGSADSFETRREKTGAALMGALFGLALIVGSAFGGAFSGGDAGFVPQDAGNQIAAVSQR